MKALKILPLFCLLFFNCSGQDKQKQVKTPNLKPDENITVNKEYDEYGNLKRYDSIYSYSYSSNGKISDSLTLQFQKHFNNHSLFNDSFFDDFFGKDSSTGGFYPDNFFHNGFMNHNKQIEDMMKRMDSIQKLFFNKRLTPIVPAEPEKEKPLKNSRQI
ncbi:hypothetical protein E1J38_012445 [Seonamhaeicola sediminis]|uniref:Uncharacterized protein n=1 Tax=Seonamhaeicola sediminis TaxID=2528206 RepID=A0A562YC85_9FLAO|nr:hypothetical protein [Seonamhaeicola sediminis]TWO31705.1 hypothetical protein E1J38_012445 [Seonamhaeicola sediminis]